jgi:hypothetical protein
MSFFFNCFSWFFICFFFVCSLGSSIKFYLIASFTF